MSIKESKNNLGEIDFTGISTIVLHGADPVQPLPLSDPWAQSQN